MSINTVVSGSTSLSLTIRSIGDPVDGEEVRVHFSDGSSDVCDVLVGAEGSGSKVSHSILIQEFTETDIQRSTSMLVSTISWR